MLRAAGIGNAEYPTGTPTDFYIAIGGSEICLCTTRAGDTFTITRGQRGTVAAAHSAQDRVQLALDYAAQSPANINDLLVNYAGVPQSYITLPNWQAEITTYLNTVYTATIPEPTSVADLISELIEQVGLVLWWDDIAQQIRLQVLRPVASTADVYDATNYLAGSFNVTEQPEKRLTQVYTYFAKINPLIANDQINNYRSTSFIKDVAAEVSYGTPVIKKVYSRWIASGGRAVADTLGQLLLARFRDPPRRVAFNILRGSLAAPQLGLGYQIGGYPFQNVDGTAAMVPGQITRLNPRADLFEVEVEEISANTIAVSSPDNHVIIFDANQNNVNLRVVHDSIYGVPPSGTTVNATINAGVVIGATSTGNAAFNVGAWPAGITINLAVKGKIEGKGGAGGAAPSGSGGGGGTALLTRNAITIDPTGAFIWGGGGGGGAGGSQFTDGGGAGGGGGGAGVTGGAAGAGSTGTIGGTGNAGTAGTATTGGNGGAAAGANGPGGKGGNPGLAGSAGTATGGAHGAAGSGGALGNAIDGISFVHYIAGSPSTASIIGGQVN